VVHFFQIVGKDVCFYKHTILKANYNFLKVKPQFYLMLNCAFKSYVLKSQIQTESIYQKVNTFSYVLDANNNGISAYPK
jgi:hypothetical protein